MEQQAPETERGRGVGAAAQLQEESDEAESAGPPGETRETVRSRGSHGEMGHGFKCSFIPRPGFKINRDLLVKITSSIIM